VVEELSSQAVEAWMLMMWMSESPGVVTGDDPAGHGSSHRRDHRRGRQHQACQGRDLRRLRHHCQCRRLSVICTRVVGCKMALEIEAAEQDLVEWEHTETCQTEGK
jgi:hypothetical protein